MGYLEDEVIQEEVEAARDRKEKATDSADRLGPIALFWLFACLNLVIAGVGAVDYHHGRKSLQWPSVPGKIVDAKIVEKTGKGGPWYRVEPTYKFAVGSEEHIGYVLDFSAVGDTNKAKVEELLKRYAPGTNVVVYYDPDSPNRSCLQPGADTSRLIHYFVLACGAVGYGSWLITTRRREDETVGSHSERE